MGGPPWDDVPLFAYHAAVRIHVDLRAGGAQGAGGTRARSPHHPSLPHKVEGAVEAAGHRRHVDVEDELAVLQRVHLVVRRVGHDVCARADVRVVLQCEDAEGEKNTLICAGGRRPRNARAPGRP